MPTETAAPAEREVLARSALTRSRIGGVEFALNPYRGCAHGCGYCYMPAMAARRGETPPAPWGRWVEAKVNLPDLLEEELRRRRKPPGRVMLSSACDAWQPAEARRRITRRCLEILARYGWGIDVLTRSPLVLRDLEILRAAGATVGMSIPTESDSVRRAIEPAAPSIEARVRTLAALREAGVETWAFIAPILPLRAERLHEMLSPHVGSYMTSAMNHYDHAGPALRRAGLGVCLGPSFASRTRGEIRRVFGAPRA